MNENPPKPTIIEGDTKSNVKPEFSLVPKPLPPPPQKPSTESKPKLKLSEKHTTKAIEICKNNVTKRYQHKHKCKKCDGHAFLGFDKTGLVVPCDKCVSLPPLYKQWYEYVDADNILREILKDNLEAYKRRAGIVDPAEEKPE